MGIMTVFKARSAAPKLSKDDTEGAMRLYKEAIDEGLQDVRNILTYTCLLYTSLRRTIQRSVEDALSEEIIAGKIALGDRVELYLSLIHI